MGSSLGDREVVKAEWGRDNERKEEMKEKERMESSVREQWICQNVKDREHILD